MNPRRAGVYARKIGSGSVEGKEFDHYLLIKPSHLYDSKEMAQLLDGTIYEAQASGIETIPPEEQKRKKEAQEALEPRQDTEEAREQRHVIFLRLSVRS